MTDTDDRGIDDVMIVGINAGSQDGADIVFRWNNEQFTVCAFTSCVIDDDEGISTPEAAVENQVIDLLNNAVDAPDEEYEELANEALDVIIAVGKTAFSDVRLSKDGACPPKRDLHSLLYPERLDFRLQTIKGKPSLVRISPDEAYSVPEGESAAFFTSAFCPDGRVPRYSSKDVVVQDILVSGAGIVSRVHVDGKDMLCKARKEGLQNSGLEQELTSMQKIWSNESRPAIIIKVPPLLGYITHADHGHIIGFLRSWVPSSHHGESLRHVNVSTVSLDVRQKWAEQIRQAVKRLHDIGVIWGDGKASNVIVDPSDNTWLIDFAGGWSSGWVNEELAGTAAGDDQAVENIFKFLKIST